MVCVDRTHPVQTLKLIYNDAFLKGKNLVRLDELRPYFARLRELFVIAPIDKYPQDVTHCVPEDVEPSG